MTARGALQAEASSQARWGADEDVQSMIVSKRRFARLGRCLGAATGQGTNETCRDHYGLCLRAPRSRNRTRPLMPGVRLVPATRSGLGPQRRGTNPRIKIFDVGKRDPRIRRRIAFISARAAPAVQ